MENVYKELDSSFKKAARNFGKYVEKRCGRDVADEIKENVISERNKKVRRLCEDGMESEFSKTSYNKKGLRNKVKTSLSPSQIRNRTQKYGKWYLSPREFNRKLNPKFLKLN